MRLLGEGPELIHPLIVYGVCSACFVIINKFILKQIPYPLAVTAFQQSLVALSYFSRCFLSSPKAFPSNALRREHLRLCCPCVVSFVVMIVANQYCLGFTDISLYVIARASTLLFSAAFSYYFLTKPQNKTQLCGCALILIAVFVAYAESTDQPHLLTHSHTPTHSSKILRGMVCGLLASAAQAAFGVQLSQIMAKRDRRKLETGDSHTHQDVPDNYTVLGHYTTMSCLCLFALMPVELRFLPTKIPSKSVLFAILLSGLVNALVAESALAALERASPVSLTVAGYLKSAAQTLLSAALFSDPLTPRRLLGLLAIFGGSFVYFQGSPSKGARRSGVEIAEVEGQRLLESQRGTEAGKRAHFPKGKVLRPANRGKKEVNSGAMR